MQFLPNICKSSYNWTAGEYDTPTKKGWRKPGFLVENKNKGIYVEKKKIKIPGLLHLLKMQREEKNPKQQKPTEGRRWKLSLLSCACFLAPLAKQVAAPGPHPQPSACPLPSLTLWKREELSPAARKRPGEPITPFMSVYSSSVCFQMVARKKKKKMGKESTRHLWDGGEG